MKKICMVLGALALTVLSVVIIACTKEKEKKFAQINSEMITVTKEDDISTYLEQFKEKMQSALKGDETLSMEDARWHLDAVLNYTYGDAGHMITDIQRDTFCYEFYTDENEVTLAQLNEVFHIFSKNVEEAFASCDLPEKNILVIQTKFKNDCKNGNTTVQMITSTGGLLEPAWPPVFGETDYWYENEYSGKCGAYAGECIGRGATTELTRMANYRIPQYGCGTGYRTYLYGIDEYWVGPGLIDPFLDDENSPCGSKLYERHTDDGCIPPDEMNYYLSKSIEIIQHYTPNDKIPISCEYDWDEILGYDKNRSGECHYIKFLYGTFECVPDSSIQ